MKAMYIQLLTTCCLTATISHAAENQGRSYINAALGQTIKRYVSTVGNEKPAIFPHTDARLFHHGKLSRNSYEKNTVSHPKPTIMPDTDTSLFVYGKFSEKPYAKNTTSHPTPSCINQVNPHITDELALIFMPEIDEEIIQAVIGNQTDIQSAQTTVVEPSIVAQNDIASEADGYASDASSVFNEEKHISSEKLSGSRFSLSDRGYGYSYKDAALFAITKKEVAGKRAKMRDKTTCINLAFSDLHGATPEEASTIVKYASKKGVVITPANLQAAITVAKQVELAALATIDPLILAAKAQEARVKAAQSTLIAEEAKLKTTEDKILPELSKHTEKIATTTTLLHMSGIQSPEESAIQANIPAHETIATNIQARKALLQTKHVATGGSASTTALQN